MNKRIKVIEYLEGSLSDGGAETLVKDYCLLLNKDEFEPYVLVDFVFLESANYRRLKESPTRIISLYPRYSFFWRGINKFFRDSYINWRLKKVIRKIKPDVLHIHLSALKRVERIMNELDGVRLLYTCHNEPWFYFDNMPDEEKAAKVLIKEKGLRLIALREDMAVTLNKKFNLDNTVVIKNGINFDRFRRLNKTREEMREELKIPKEAFLIGHIGRFNEQKNHSFLIDVFASVKKERDDAVLLLVGNGEAEREIREKINSLNLSSSVIIISNREDIPEILNALDTFVFPSLFEGLGIVLVEAQSVGLKCVISDTINEEVYLSNLVIPLSLNDPLEKWRDAILDKERRSDYPNRIDEYDMNKEIKKLERLYKGEE